MSRFQKSFFCVTRKSNCFQICTSWEWCREIVLWKRIQSVSKRIQKHCHAMAFREFRVGLLLTFGRKACFFCKNWKQFGAKTLSYIYRHLQTLSACDRSVFCLKSDLKNIKYTDILIDIRHFHSLIVFSIASCECYFCVGFCDFLRVYVKKKDLILALTTKMGAPYLQTFTLLGQALTFLCHSHFLPQNFIRNFETTIFVRGTRKLSRLSSHLFS